MRRGGCINAVLSAAVAAAFVAAGGGAVRWRSLREDARVLERARAEEALGEAASARREHRTAARHFENAWDLYRTRPRLLPRMLRAMRRCEEESQSRGGLIHLHSH